MMAAHMISLARKEYAAEWRPRGIGMGSEPAPEPSTSSSSGSSASPAPSGDPVEPKRVRPGLNRPRG